MGMFLRAKFAKKRPSQSVLGYFVVKLVFKPNAFLYFVRMFLMTSATFLIIITTICTVCTVQYMVPAGTYCFTILLTSHGTLNGAAFHATKIDFHISRVRAVSNLAEFRQ